MDNRTAAQHAKQLKGLLRSFEYAEEVLNLAASASEEYRRLENELPKLKAVIQSAKNGAVEAAEVVEDVKAASTKRLEEIKRGLSKKVKETGERADTKLADIAERVRQAIRAEEENTKEIEGRISKLEQRETGVTNTCDEAEKRLRRLQAELAKLG